MSSPKFKTIRDLKEPLDDVDEHKKIYKKPEEINEYKLMNLTKDEIVIKMLGLYEERCKSAREAYEANNKILQIQENENKRATLKQGFNTIENRYIKCTSINEVLKDSLNQMLRTIISVYGGTGGIIVLDIPQNKYLGAKNDNMKPHTSLFSYWMDDLDYDGLDNLEGYDDIIVRKTGKTFSQNEIKRKYKNKKISSLTVIPIISENTTVGLLVSVNQNINKTDINIICSSMNEIWTTNIKSLISIVIERKRIEETNERLMMESMERNNIILDLEIIIDEIVKDAATKILSMNTMWELILKGVANYMEDKYKAEVFISVTNVDSNLRLRTSKGSHSSKTGETKDMAVMYYVFSKSAEHIRQTKMKNLKTPELKNAEIMATAMNTQKIYYTNDTSHFKLPAGHMKMKNVLLVPIIFQSEPVALLGMANGDFDETVGRIISSVFTTFWSMIVKSTALSYTTNTLNATIPKIIGERMLENPKICDEYNNASVIFMDITDYTKFCDGLEPNHIVEYLNYIYKNIDKLTVDHDIEKIKVVGDCYMAVGGIHNKTGTDINKYTVSEKVYRENLSLQTLGFVESVFKLCKEINEKIDEISLSEELKEKIKKQPLQMRAGVSLGKITAGVFGEEKIQYDVFGSEVNLASRLESTGLPGKIHVSPRVYESIFNVTKYATKKREEEINIKGFGKMKTYFIDV